MSGNPRLTLWRLGVAFVRTLLEPDVNTRCDWAGVAGLVHILWTYQEGLSAL
jgi:hypothetical protein